MIDLIRGFAALMVAFDHGLLPRSLPLPFDQKLLLVAKVVICAPAAVLVFFVISGFCIHIPNVGKPINAKHFLIRRFTRLGVPLLGASVIAYALGYRWFEMPFGGPVIWSLACEAVYYVLYLPLQPLLKTHRQWLSLIGVLFALAFVIGFDGRSVLEYPTRGFWATTVLGLPIWLSGAYVAELVKKPGKHFDFSLASKWFLWAIILLGGGVASVLKHEWHWSYALTLTAYGLFIAPWLYAGSFSIGIVGDMSYSLYLLHLPLIEPTRNLLERWIGSTYTLTVDVACIVAILLITMLFYTFVEKPSHALARRLAT
jgi:peptidoglycan/LPS O-acetylase OafA/YrhL